VGGQRVERLVERVDRRRADAPGRAGPDPSFGAPFVPSDVRAHAYPSADNPRRTGPRRGVAMPPRSRRPADPGSRKLYPESKGGRRAMARGWTRSGAALGGGRGRGVAGEDLLDLLGGVADVRLEQAAGELDVAGRDRVDDGDVFVVGGVAAGAADAFGPDHP